MKSNQEKTRRRSPVSLREAVLLVAIVSACAGWYTEHTAKERIEREVKPIQSAIELMRVANPTSPKTIVSWTGSEFRYRLEREPLSDR
jgi:hypothetical protein